MVLLEVLGLRALLGLREMPVTQEIKVQREHPAVQELVDNLDPLDNQD